MRAVTESLRQLGKGAVSEPCSWSFSRRLNRFATSFAAERLSLRREVTYNAHEICSLALAAASTSSTEAGQKAVPETVISGHPYE
jgi:hypothetical protein